MSSTEPALSTPPPLSASTTPTTTTTPPKEKQIGIYRCPASNPICNFQGNEAALERNADHHITTVRLRTVNSQQLFHECSQKMRRSVEGSRPSRDWAEFKANQEQAFVKQREKQKPYVNNSITCEYSLSLENNCYMFKK